MMTHRLFRLVLLLALALLGGLLPLGLPAEAQETTAAYRVYLPLGISQSSQPPANPGQPPANPGQPPTNPGDPSQPGNPSPPPTGSFFLPGEAPTRNFAAAYDSAGVMHLVFVRHTRAENVQELLYGQCPAGAPCDRVESWHTVVIHSGNIGSVQLAVTADGRPRLAIQDEYTTVSVRLAYMACEANCLTNAGWEGIALGQGLSFGGAFLQHSDQRWFAIDRSGLPHMLVATQEGSSYLSCSQACATGGEGWSVTPLDTNGDAFVTTQLFDPVLRVGGDGRIHVLGRISRPELVYLTCASNCASAGSWQRLVIADYNQQAISDQIPMAVYPANLDLELDRAGGVVVGFGGPTPGVDAPQRSYLLRCASNCAEAAGWSGRPFANNGAFGLNMQLDRQDRPFWLLAAATSENGERVVELATCTAGDCYAPGANWQARVISNSGAMEAVLPLKNPAATPPVCNIPTTSWEQATNQLLFTPDGSMRLLTNAVGTSICQPGMDEWIDQWGTKKRGRTVDLWVLTARVYWTITP